MCIATNLCIGSISFPIYDILIFEINLSFLIKPFFFITKESRKKKFDTLRAKTVKGEKKSNEKYEMKTIFHYFKRLSVA